MKRILRVGCIGLGSRGRGLMKKLIQMQPSKVVGLFDLKQPCIDQALEDCKALGETRVKVYPSAQAMFDDKNVDAVVIATSWAAHIPLATAAMKAGKAVGLEVGPAMSIEDLFTLVDVCEKTNGRLMFLENACFGRDELLAINLIKEGVLGEIVHAVGGYQHEVADLVYKEFKNMNTENAGNERILNRINRNMEPYPTHGIGPVAKALGINRGNRFISLNSVSSKAAGLKAYIERTDGKEAAYDFPRLAQGDVITTMLKCAHGETVVLTWNTVLPAPASRLLKFHGTNGMINLEKGSIYVNGVNEKGKWANKDDYKDKYKHPAFKWFDRNKYQEKLGLKPGSHADMDFITLFAFVDCTLKEYDYPIDVYDAATWMAISVLAEQSLALGSAPVFFPDFTSGKWMRRGELKIDERWDCGV